MSEGLTKAIDALRIEESKLQERVHAMRSEIKSAEAELKQVRGALSALKGTRTEKTAKPAANRNDVLQVVADVIRSVDAVSVDELRKVVEQEISESGKSRTGLALRFNEVLKDKKFIHENGQLRSAESKLTQQPPSISEQQLTPENNVTCR